MKKIPVFLSAALLLGVPLTACGGTPNSSSQQEEIDIESLSLSAAQNYVKVGSSLQLTLSIFPLNASNTSVTYSATNDCVTVSQTGLVTGMKIGSCSVVATSYNEKQAVYNLEVVPEGDHSYLDIAEYSDVLSESPYMVKDISGQGKYGLSDGKTVGVDRDEIKEKYSLKSDGEIGANYILSLDDITIEQVKKYFPDAEQKNDYYLLQTAIFMAKEFNESGHAAKIKLPSRILHIETKYASTAHTFVLNGIDGLYIEGNQSTLLFEIDGLNYKGFFSTENSKNVYFSDFTIDVETPSSLTGAITSVDLEKQQIEIKVEPEFNDLIERLLITKKNLRSYVEFNYLSRVPLQGGNFVVDGFKDYSISGDKENGYSIAVTFNSPIARSRNQTLVSLQFSQYDASGFVINRSENIFIENMTMHHAYGMAFTSSETTNLYVNRFNLALKENSSSLMTATADAMHLNSMHGDVKITNSLLENSHDDALNIKHGYWYKLTNAEGGSSRTITVNKLTGAVETPKIGDRIAVYDQETFEGHNPTSGYYTIAEITPATNGYTFKVNERMSNVGEWGSCRVTFLSDTPNFEFSNNIVRNKRNRGVLVQVPNALIANNAFMNVGHGSIQAASAMDVFNEATLPQGLTIRDNKFINNCYLKPEPLYGDISIFAISNNASVAPSGTLHSISIENNFIAKNSNAAISLRGVGDSSMKHNLFYECSQSQPSGETFNCIFHLYNCADLQLEENYNQYTLENGLSGIVTQGKTRPEDIATVNNYQIDYQRNEEAGPEVQVGKATGKIVIDGNIDEWASVQATDILIDGVSDAEGNAHTLESLSNHFAVNKLMMTYDDEGLYLAFDVKDDDLVSKTVNDFWLGDCVEIFMSTITDMPNADMQVYKEDGGVLQAALAPNWSANQHFTFSSARTNSAYIEKSSLVKANVQTTQSGYCGELMIPFAMAPEFKTSIENNKPIDMAIVVADAERASMGLKRIQAANVPHFVENYKTKTARMPQYFFK